MTNKEKKPQFYMFDYGINKEDSKIYKKEFNKAYAYIESVKEDISLCLDAVWAWKIFISFKDNKIPKGIKKSGFKRVYTKTVYNYYGRFGE